MSDERRQWATRSAAFFAPGPGTNRKSRRLNNSAGLICLPVNRVMLLWPFHACLRSRWSILRPPAARHGARKKADKPTIAKAYWPARRTRV